MTAADKQRYKIVIEYDGAQSYGWQRQEKVIAVQEKIEHALNCMTHQAPQIEGSGRTDRGVHALGQVAHFDLVGDYSPYKLLGGLNFFLQEKGVTIVACETVDSTFHARFSAKLRTYHYYVFNRATPSVHFMNNMWHVKYPLDLDMMREAAQDFIGHHDFSSFRAVDCQANSPMKTLERFDLVQLNEHIFRAEIASRSFLYNQVRIMMGTLKEIGSGQRTRDSIRHLLLQGDRTKAGITAPPHGLYFYEVSY